jgi:hypothetical protein
MDPPHLLVFAAPRYRYNPHQNHRRRHRHGAGNLLPELSEACQELAQGLGRHIEKYTQNTDASLSQHIFTCSLQTALLTKGSLGVLSSAANSK